MTATEARRTLDANDAAIARNVADLFAGRIDFVTFDVRQRAAHDAIHAAGQSDAWRRRFRRALNPNGAP